MQESDINETSSSANEIDSEYLASPVKNKNVRNLVGFWILGLCNNYAYVIMLSAAFDLLDPNYHENEDLSVNDSANKTNETLCNPISTGAILLADILPALFIKSVASFIVLGTHYRVFIAVTLCVMSFLITAFSIANWMTFFGVICASLSSGLGEVTFLSYSSFFDKDSVSTWSSGTGGAGLIGALSYASLTHVMGQRTALLVMLVVPVVMSITFWIIIQHPTPSCGGCKGNLCGSEFQPMLQDSIELSVKKTDIIPRHYSFHEKLALIKPLLKFMVPLGFVYFAEYFINQGLMELLYFRNASSWLTHKDQYRWYQVDYQFGVLISRSSVNFFQIKKLWLLPLLQFINVFLLLLEVRFPFIPSIWIVLLIVLYEGLLGGSAYVNTFYRISSEISEENKEFSMGIACLADSIGIALAGIISLPVHDALCKIVSRPL